MQRTLRHDGVVLTADTYVSVLPHLYHDSARTTSRLMTRHRRSEW
ncbi:hypothetical protein [Nonomuraea sp. NPDC049625]